MCFKLFIKADTESTELNHTTELKWAVFKKEHKIFLNSATL